MELHLIRDEIKPGWLAPEGQNYLPLHVRAELTVTVGLTALSGGESTHHRLIRDSNSRHRSTLFKRKEKKGSIFEC